MFYPIYSNENESHFWLSKCMLLPSITLYKRRRLLRRASCFNDYKNDHCLVFATFYHNLRRRNFGKPKTLLCYFTPNYYLRQANILSIATICSTDIPAWSLLALLTSGITLSALKRNAFPPLAFQSLTLSS